LSSRQRLLATRFLRIVTAALGRGWLLPPALAASLVPAIANASLPASVCLAQGIHRRRGGLPRGCFRARRRQWFRGTGRLVGHRTGCGAWADRYG